MPRYEYNCEECGENQHQWHKFEETPEPCEACGSTKLKKVIGAPAIRMGGRQSMSVRHTTQETFGPHPTGQASKIGHVEYYPEEVKAKKEEHRKKEEGKGTTIIMPKSIKKKSSKK
jgi:putative FmdB family regulatory protein